MIIMSMVGIVLFLTLVGVAYRQRKRIALFIYAGNFFRRTFNGARLKIIFVLYQTISSVMWGVPNVAWPEPFSSFAAVAFKKFFVFSRCSARLACFFDHFVSPSAAFSSAASWILISSKALIAPSTCTLRTYWG